jgi:signal transduction histidine kinase
MQALINLMKNAIEAMDNMKTGKTIKLSAGHDGNQFTNLHIADTGCGIPLDETDKIFIPFFSTKAGGSGIGLSIAHQIIQKQKGNLTFASELGKGTVFTASFVTYKD